MENKNLQSELDWIDKHPQFYIDDVHREDVKFNITLGYQVRELEGQLNTVAIHERAALELKIGNLKDSRRYSRKVDYVSIKCPPIPKTKDELKTERGKSILSHIVPGHIENKGIFDGRSVR